MRSTLFILATLLSSYSLLGQVKGDGNIITQQIDIGSVTDLDISLYAKIEVDMSQGPSMTISMDANLLDLIDLEVIDGHLMLDQKKWIKPSQDIVIKLGAPELSRVQQGTHETVFVRNMNTDEFVASALVGEILLEGQTDQLSANGEVGDIDATNLDVQSVNVNLWGWGKIKLGNPNDISGQVKGAGQVIYSGNQTSVDVKTSDDGRVIDRSQEEIVRYDDKARFIKLKLKNNSAKRINAYVRGPKPDGTFFSYGFPMRPGQVRKKDWSIGSKVFKVSGLGLKKLLLEITEDDEGELVMMYAK